MFAIIENNGKQLKVTKDLQIRIDKVEAKEGEKITFSNVLLLSDGKTPKIGAPNIEGASVTAKIIKHAKEKKILVFKKKRRQNYRRKNGHRQDFTLVQIENIKS